MQYLDGIRVTYQVFIIIAAMQCVVGFAHVQTLLAVVTNDR